MSYFNEPTRMAILSIMPEVDKLNNKKPISNTPSKGLLTRNTNMSDKKNDNKGKSEINKVIQYMSIIRTEMRKHKDAL